VYSIIRQTQVIPELIGFVSPVTGQFSREFIGHIGQIDEIVRVNRVDEIIFCALEISSRQIIHTMLKFTNIHVDFKIAPPESLSVIGSNSNQTPGEIYAVYFNTLSRTLTRRKKRFFDIGIAFILLCAFPLIAFMVKRPLGLIRNIFQIFGGSLSWVGYIPDTTPELSGLPPLRTGILTLKDDFTNSPPTPISAEQLNLGYAQDYSTFNDLRRVWVHFTKLGRNPFEENK
jgi:hypothetical protein